MTVPDRRLAVQLYGTRIGTLTGDDRRFEFEAHRDALDTFGLASTVLSESLPLRLTYPGGGWQRRQNFFTELLPEGEVLGYMAAEAGVHRWEQMSLLAHYGRDVAGAVQIWDEDDPSEPSAPNLRPLDDTGVAQALRDQVSLPLGNVHGAGKSSLNGVQPKIVLAYVDGRWNGVEDGYPSTHILKPAPKDDPSTIFDEEWGSRFARKLGLLDYEVELAQFDGEHALVIERYDRDASAPAGRIHQEDMNQALGAAGNEKYQELGGRMSLARIAKLFSSRGDDDSLRRLIQLTTLSVAVGNLDMHGKNLSIIHLPDSSVTLAPAYDIVPQAHRPNDGKVALAVNGTYVHSALTALDIVEEAKSWGMRQPETVVLETLESVLHVAMLTHPNANAHPAVTIDIHRFTKNLLEGKPVGHSVAKKGS
jgi:serine/threonine-protein kinase HipA